MSKNEDLNTENLDRFIKSLKNLPSGSIGVLGSKDLRSGNVGSNASIGAKHEMGADGMIQRSWLREPIIDHLNEFLEKSGAFTPVVLKEVIKSGSIKAWMTRVMIVAESVIAEGFASGGFGKWRPSNMNLKKNKQTLVETQQLRNSVTSEVKGD